MQVNILLFPALTQLDLTGPYEVLTRAPGFRVDLVSPTLEPVCSDRGMILQPTTTFAAATACDLLVVPGGPGTDAVMLDERWVSFTAQQAAQARFIMGICTGSLLLGAAGLLQGRHAACHWQARDFLSQFGAIARESRTCVDGNIFTSGGVTSGIDMAIQAVALMLDDDTARQIQLQIEYDPQPPFAGGTPSTSPEHIVRRCLQDSSGRQKMRSQAVALAAQALRARNSDGLS